MMTEEALNASRETEQDLQVLREQNLKNLVGYIILLNCYVFKIICYFGQFDRERKPRGKEEAKNKSGFSWFRM